MGLLKDWIAGWREGPVAEVEAEALADALAGEAAPVVLDVRSTTEFRQGHVAGALHVPIQSLARRYSELALPRDRPIVTVCLTGHRSIPAVHLLRGRGHAEVAQLRGGMTAWWRARLPTARGAG